MRISSLRAQQGVVIEARPPMIPHGERLPKRLADPTDTLPLPKCSECGRLIYYTLGRWHHHDGDMAHGAAVPEEAP